VAAYEIDKLLGLGMVPPTVERGLGGRRGCLQLWVEGVTLEKFADSPPDLDPWRRQVSLMWLLDDLVANIDRHVANIIVTPEFRLALIDNSKTFRGSRELLYDLNRAASSGTRARHWLIPYDERRETFPTTYPADIAERLRALTSEGLKQAAGRYLDSNDRRLLLARRDLVLERLRQIEETPP
jgi:hypothetical protein